MIINVYNVSKRLGKRDVLQDINLSLTSGKIYGLWGMNGSGKTMLMRVISGLVRPTHGYVDADGCILGKDISFPTRMGLFLERPAFLDNYTGFDNLDLLAKINKTIGNDEICKAMEEMGLNPSDTRKYKKYSLGMKQKLGITAATMENPDLILLDEPTNSLDEASISMLRNVIENRRKNGALIVISSHDKDFLYSVSDKIHHIDSGTIKEYIYEK